jgi:CRISPR system Cascade subunit CasA
MPQKEIEFPQFNLWTDAWIQLEKPEGGKVHLGIEQALLNAHLYNGIYEASPLFIVGIHRLLTAILQFILAPNKEAELIKLWNIPNLPSEKIMQFGQKYAHRFDLFSVDEPFYQSADVPIEPHKGDNLKSVAYLAHDIPSGTQQTHYHHGNEDDQCFCPVCLAGGLVSLPAFSTSGGRGIKPSINGVPPLYVIPGGKTLLESLMLSLTLPDYQPQVRSTGEDLAWWVRKPIVPRNSEVISVGYLHSLTFATRRVRLFPERMDTACTRCGVQTHWGVRKVIFEMGECRPKKSPAWFDPFAAYHIREKGVPVPVRPIEGKATWREFGNLFLKFKEEPASGKKYNDKHVRPSVLDQISVLTEGDKVNLPVRCVGMRTDMKAKIFEWIDTGFEIPIDLLRDLEKAYWLEKGLSFSTDAERSIANAFRKSFGGKNLKKQERYSTLKNNMINQYWNSLSVPFRKWVLELSASSQPKELYQKWINQVIRVGQQVFSATMNSMNDDAVNLRKRVQGEQTCNAYLLFLKNKEVKV